MIKHFQDDDSSHYSASSLLSAGEVYLKNYNKWIALKIINSAKCNFAIGNDTKILDFGAGIGSLSVLFRFHTGVAPDCVEIDSTQCSIIEKRGFKVFSSLSELNKKYSIIFSSNVLEHIKDDDQVLKNLRTVLDNENSILILYLPAFNALWTTMDERVGHYRRYTKKQLRLKLESSGYVVESLKYCDSMGFILSILFKFTGNKGGEPSNQSLYFYDNFICPLNRILDPLFGFFFGKNIYAVAKISTDY